MRGEKPRLVPAHPFEFGWFHITGNVGNDRRAAFGSVANIVLDFDEIGHHKASPPSQRIRFENV